MEMLRWWVTRPAHTVGCQWLRCGAVSFHHFGERQRSVGQEELSDLSVPCLLVCALSSHPPCNLARATPFAQKRTKVSLGLCVFTVGLFSFTDTSTLLSPLWSYSSFAVSSSAPQTHFCLRAFALTAHLLGTFFSNVGVAGP